MRGINFKASIETGVVVFKLLILLIFVALGLATLGKSDQTGRLAFSEWTSPFRLLAGGMVIFVADEGFELIANTADDIEKPKHNLPAAYFSSHSRAQFSHRMAV